MLWPILPLVAALAAESQLSTTAADGTPGPGIPLALAEARAQRVSDLRYDLHLTIPEKASERLQGRITIRFKLRDGSKSLPLDFGPVDGLLTATIAGRDVVLDRVPDHLVIPADRLRVGENELSIEFLAGDAPLNRNQDFLYTLFVPARAHLAVPCFDQPDLKGRWTLGLDLPAGWEAIANGAVQQQRVAGGRVHLRFAETKPLPTYLVAFAAGRFKVEVEGRRGRTFRMLHRETDAAKVARNRDAIFDLHGGALEWLERYTGIPYPWGKFDFLLVPSFQFGGMEHAGSIFYNASALLLDPSATQNQKLGRASLIAHETSHMWFGDLVTMRWFDDVWLKEVFANFMAAKIVNPAFPEINHDLRFLYAHYPAAYDVDRTPGTNAIRQPLDNLRDAGTLYGAIIYQKAPIVMRQLESIVGDDELRDGLREYLLKFQFANATWPDLIALLDSRTHGDLAAWSRAWVEEPGRPTIVTQLRIEGGRIADLALAQRDPTEGRGLVWNQRLNVVIGGPHGIRTVPVRLDGPRAVIGEARGLPAPDFVLPTGGGRAYGGFVLDAGTIAWLLSSLPEIADPLTRGAAWVSLWDQMLDGRAKAADIVNLALKALPRESDEQNIQRILGYTQLAYWRFLSAEERGRLAPNLERELQRGLDGAATPSLKSAWFSALRDTAISAAVLERLQQVWKGTVSVPGLTLAEPDFISLALELAVRGVPDWQPILERQHARIENPDRKARFEFVRAALSPDPAAREAFFESLKVVENRRREPWVLEALRYLHHPLRASASEKLILPSLQMLPEIQRTGDIFFPKRWTDATLGGHSSPAAARIVKEFLDTLPADYPERLHRIVLSSSDDLFRASGVARSGGG